ncbi:HBL/NHE enterotoxin family protein [Bacillus thuringiensis]|uniref:HBL/NHE enterotoxin family protein n=1 Tax=Bacillus thuringiensis TaxID=1428 RepID=UPI003D01A7BD
MKMVPFKVLAIPALSATMLFTGLAPTYAAEVSVKTSVIETKQGLSPDHFNEIIKSAMSSINGLDMYAKNVQVQADFNLTNSGLTPELRSKIIGDQQQARTNVGAWRDSVKPTIIQTTRQIFSFGTQFNNYYQPLMKAADDKNKSKLVNGLGLLRTQVQKNQQATKDLIVVLQNFRTQIVSDSQNFSNDSEEVLKTIGDKKEYTKRLMDLIKQAELDISNGKDLLTMAAAKQGAGIFHTFIAALRMLILGGDPSAMVEWMQSGYLTAEARQLARQGHDMVRKGQAHKERASNELMVIDMNLKSLSVTKEGLATLTSAVDKAIIYAQSLVNQWDDMDSKYNSLISNINNVNTDDLTFVKEDLNIAKLTWDDIEKQAQYLNN